MRVADRILLAAPLGEPGSGRVRYGAAMALYRAGLICEATLETYREAAAHDGRDPALMLQARGLPPVRPPDGAAALVALAEAAEDYLLSLDHEGAAEVAEVLRQRSGTPEPQPPQAVDVVARWLDRALAVLERTHPELAARIAAAAPHLGWRTYQNYPPASIGAAFAAGHAFAPLLGWRGPFFVPDVSCGLFLIAPQVLYRDHAHPAPELYAPLTGPHGWRFAPGEALTVLPAHVPVWNPPHRPHLTKIGPVPFLCLYVWTRDARLPAQILPAPDWPALEALIL